MKYEYEVQRYYNDDGKKDGWIVLESREGTGHYFVIDIYPYKRQAVQMAKKLIENQG
jgi:hypothetical protein